MTTLLSTAQSGVGLAVWDAVGVAVSETGVPEGVPEVVAVADELAVMGLEGVWLVEAPSVPELVGVTVLLGVGVELTEGSAGAHATPTSAALTEPAPDT